MALFDILHTKHLITSAFVDLLQYLEVGCQVKFISPYALNMQAENSEKRPCGHLGQRLLLAIWH